MRKFIFIILVPFIFFSCKKEMVDFDRTECSTLVRVKIDEAYLYQLEGYIHLESTLTGGLGQNIHYVGYCWSKDFNVAPVKDSNSIYIPYESIVKSSVDVNADGKIDQQDYFADGSMIVRTYSSDIPINFSGVNIIKVRAFVSFNDSLAIYSPDAYLPVN